MVYLVDRCVLSWKYFRYFSPLTSVTDENGITIPFSVTSIPPPSPLLEGHNGYGGEEVGVRRVVLSLRHTNLLSLVSLTP